MSQEGRKTSEYQITKETGLLAWVGTVAGIIIAVAPIVIQNSPEGSTASLIAGTALAISSQITKLFNSRGYQDTRKHTKIAEANGKAPVE
jgi:hypothetical protein